MKQSLVHQAVRYLLSGGIVYAVDMAVFLGIMHFAPGAHLAANFAAKAAGAFTGFFLHKYVTFSWAQRDAAARQALAYVLLLCANLAGSTALLWLLVDWGGLPALAGKILTDAAVILATFLGGRFFVYRPA